MRVTPPTIVPFAGVPEPESSTVLPLDSLKLYCARGTGYEVVAGRAVAAADVPAVLNAATLM